MAVMLKDIRLKPVIGNWYEYKPREHYTNDFETANLNTEQINELLEVHHKWADYFGQLISLNLKISCGAQETSLTKVAYADLARQVPGSSASFEVNAGQYTFTVVLDAALAYALLDRACGGQGWPLKKLNDALTNPEKAALNVLCGELLKSYRAYLLEAFASAAPGEIVAPNLQPELKLKKDDEMLVFANTFYLADNKPASILFIYLEKQLEHLYETYVLQKEMRPRKLTVQLSPHSIGDVKVPVNIRIGTTKITINEIMGMAAGDILQLNEKITDSLVMSVAEQGEFFVKLGSRADNYAVKIIDHKPKNAHGNVPQVTVNTLSRKVEPPAPPAELIEPPAPPELPAAPPPVQDKPVQDKPAEPLPADYDIEVPALEDAPEVLDNEPMTEETLDPEVKYQPPTIDEQSVAYLSDGKVDSEKLEIKDPLLDELADTDTGAADNDEFTWDIDDLK
ncbi:flagellar motor switch protein FliM [Candidatus Termititenax persephonae]|uniref:Flagellar motor switch protein FliM n=1 Tax=Candidatus Termititenax persephonae TaxID=2218525 RepID=A0A388TIG7_9BACT|nr:flagellar motor switch protein FliM [Candidatus Termititenax persephonae]